MQGERNTPKSTSCEFWLCSAIPLKFFRPGATVLRLNAAGFDLQAIASINKKEGANLTPSIHRKLSTQCVVANATLWNVEYSASNLFTTGMPSMYRAMIFSICGYSSRL
jgi:hypothetical protein